MELASRRQAGGRRTRKCNTCRERKVKCDQQEPFCGTCKRIGYTCKGYNSPVIIVPSRLQNRLGRLPDKKDSDATRERNNGNAFLLIDRQALCSVPRPPVDSAASFRSYFLLRLVSDVSCCTGMVGMLSKFLDEGIAENSLQYRCIKAPTTSYYAMRASDSHACEESMRTYSDALKDVRFAVARRHRQFDPDILMSIMCLSLYENIIVTQARSWIEHYIAISHMIEMQGPEYYQTGRNRDILLAFRYTIIVSAGTRRYHCFLAKKSWKGILEPREAESFGPFDTLLNIAVAVPGLLHDLDSFKIGTLSNESERSRLAHRTGDMLRALQFWREASLPVWSSEDGSLRRYSHQLASAIAFHHMIALLVEELSYLFETPWLPPFSLSSKATPGIIKASVTAGRAERRHILASEILRLGQLFISGDTAIYGVLSFIMSLHVAHDNLLRVSPEIHMIGYLMNTVIAKQHGFNMARQYRDMYKAFEDAAS